MRVVIISGDILTAAADAIVNSANSLGVMSSGLAAAIKIAGGDKIEIEAKQHSPCAIGQAYCTTAGSLPFKAVVHTPTMVHPTEPIPPKQVELATMAALRAADEAGFKSLAMPGLGTGAGQVEANTAAKIIYETVSMYLPDNALTEVQLYDSDSKFYQALLQQQTTA